MAVTLLLASDNVKRTVAVALVGPFRFTPTSAPRASRASPVEVFRSSILPFVSAYCMVWYSMAANAFISRFSGSASPSSGSFPVISR